MLFTSVEVANDFFKSNSDFLKPETVCDCHLAQTVGDYIYPQFRNLTNSLRALRSKPPRMRFLLFKLAFCHVLTDMIV
jgi:hypothetical protein